MQRRSLHHEHLWKDYVIDLRPCQRSDCRKLRLHRLIRLPNVDRRGLPSRGFSHNSASGSAKKRAGPSAAPQVDVEAVLTKLASQNKEKLDWRMSIVDLMKLLDLDSSLSARKELAKELNYTGDTNNSARMNVWLHKQVMIKLAENGGKVPEFAKGLDCSPLDARVRTNTPKTNGHREPPLIQIKPILSARSFYRMGGRFPRSWLSGQGSWWFAAGEITSNCKFEEAVASQTSRALQRKSGRCCSRAR